MVRKKKVKKKISSSLLWIYDIFMISIAKKWWLSIIIIIIIIIYFLMWIMCNTHQKEASRLDNTLKNSVHMWISMEHIFFPVVLFFFFWMRNYGTYLFAAICSLRGPTTTYWIGPLTAGTTLANDVTSPLKK